MRPSAEVFKERVGDNPVCMLELGVWTGDNAQELYDNFNCDPLYLMDKWYRYYEHHDFPQIHEYAKKVFERFDNKDDVIIIRSNTLKFDIFPKEYFNYIYFDDNHSYEHVSEELEKYYGNVKFHCMLSGDNFEIPGVEKAVDEFCKKHNLKYETKEWKKTKEGRSVLDWWVWKI